MSPKKPNPRLLTETELELMHILWRTGEGTVHDVIRGLPQGRQLAYTSVSTMLRILEQKRFLASRKAGRGHVYFPRVAKHDYEATTVEHLVANVFDGAASSLVQRLLESKDMTREELVSIRLLLEGRLEK